MGVSIAGSGNFAFSGTPIALSSTLPRAAQNGERAAMAEHLVAISLGPAHESLRHFIGDARRSHDLWAGSWLISELSRAAARAVADTAGAAALISPAPEALRLQGVPSTIVARVPGNAVGAVALAAGNAVKARLHQLADAAFARVGEGDRTRRATIFHRAQAQRQIAELLAVHWAAVPIAGSGGFFNARSKLERDLATGEAMQQWWQPPAGNAGAPGSPPDGLRLSEPGERRRAHSVHGSERLSGVGFLRRFLPQIEEAREVAARISSTDHLAALPVLKKIDSARRRASVEVAWQKYRRQLIKADLLQEFADRAPEEARTSVLGRTDGGVIYPGRVAEELKERSARETTAEELGDLENARRTFLKKAGISADPPAYYAILVAGGDSMNELVEARKTVEEQQALSRSLADFAGGVPATVRAALGICIYAGGDQVLALLPLDTALETADAIATSYRATLARFARSSNEPKGLVLPSLSAGLAIVHASSPLDESLSHARAAQEHAGARSGKNAIAVAVQTRSGEPVTVRGSWGSIVKRMSALSTLLRMNAIPEGALHELSALARLTANLQEGDPGLERARRLQRAEVKWILSRKRAPRGKRQMVHEARAELIAMLQKGKDDDAPALARALYVARVLDEARVK
jgi:CRISPR-associated protein Cmr2